MALGVVFDHLQIRRSVDRQQVSAAGRECSGDQDGGVFSSMFMDAITFTLMLRPNCLFGDWYTSNSGIYAKLGLSAFTFGGGSGGWEERQDQRGKGPWVALKDTAATDTAITTATYSKNRGFVISWFGYGGGEDFEVLHCGWNSSPTDASGNTQRVTVKFRSSGAFEVYRGGVFAGSGKVTGSRTADQKQGQFFEVMLLPFRHRELLVYGLSGDGASIEFADIDPADASPTITPATAFWFEVKSGGTQVQLAPVQFPASGFSHTQKLSFPDAPLGGAALETFANPAWVGSQPFRVFGHPAYVGTQTVTCALREWDSTTTFVPNGTRQDCRIRVSMTTTNQGYSPFVYGVAMAYAGSTGETSDAEESVVTGFVQNAELSVPDAAEGVMLNMTMGRLDALDAVAVDVRTMANRPVLATIGSEVVLNGYGDPGEFFTSANADAESMGYEVFDAWRVLETYMFTDIVPLDGLTITDALKFVVAAAFGTSVVSPVGVAFDVSASTFVIAADPNPDSNDWGFLIEAGDTAASVIAKLIDTYAATWIYGFKPTAALNVPTFYAIDTDDLPTTPAVRIYQTHAAAIADGVSADDAFDFVAADLTSEVLEPEATEVRVTGFDPRTQRPIQAFKVATALEDVTLIPSLRPAGWLGAKRHYAAVLPEIKTQSELNLVTETLFDKLTVQRTMVEFTSGLLMSGGVPLWRGDMVEIFGKGNYRVNAFSVSFIREASGKIIWRRARYTCEKVEA